MNPRSRSYPHSTLNPRSDSCTYTTHTRTHAVQFRKAVESKYACKIKPPVPVPGPLRPVPAGAVQGGSPATAPATAALPTTEELGLGPAPERDPRSVLPFEGGETAGLRRVRQYIWDEDRLREYKVTRNGLLGSGFSSKFSPWLALGCLSPKTVVREVCARAIFPGEGRRVGGEEKPCGVC